MSTNEGNFTVTSKTELVKIKPTRGFPLLIEDWNLMKARIGKIRHEHNFFYTLGSGLIGAAISILIAIFTGQIADPKLVAALAILAVCAVCGICVIKFGGMAEARDVDLARVVLEDMAQIESRYEFSEESNADAASAPALASVPASTSAPEPAPAPTLIDGGEADRQPSKSAETA